MPSRPARADIALALGVEKLKDTGYGGLPSGRGGTLHPHGIANGSAPGNFAQLATAYRRGTASTRATLKRAIAPRLGEEPRNGAKNPKAHLQKAISDGDHA